MIECSARATEGHEELLQLRQLLLIVHQAVLLFRKIQMVLPM